MSSFKQIILRGKTILSEKRNEIKMKLKFMKTWKCNLPVKSQSEVMQRTKAACKDKLHLLKGAAGYLIERNGKRWSLGRSSVG